MKRLLLNLLALAAATIVFSVAYLVVHWGITLISGIPLIGTLFYLPSDAAWVKTVMSLTSGIFAGAYCSSLIAGNAMLFSGLVIALHLFSLIRALFLSVLGFPVLVECLVAIGAAAICFPMNRNDL